MIGAMVAKKKILSGFDSMNRHDLDAFLTNWTEDAVFIYPGNFSVSGEQKGKKAVVEWFQNFMKQFPVIKFTIKNVCVENIFDLVGTNVLAVSWDIKLNNQAGEEFQNSGVTVITLKNRKAVLVRDYIFDLEVARKAWE